MVLPAKTVREVTVKLSAAELELYKKFSTRVSSEFQTLQRQGRVGDRVSRVMMWLDGLRRCALHCLLLSEERYESFSGTAAATERENERYKFLTATAAALHKKLSKPGVPSATLEALLKMTEIPPEIPDCGVCLDSMSQPTLLTCHHLFCKECILQVLSTSDNPACPACRQQNLLKEKTIVEPAREAVTADSVAAVQATTASAAASIGNGSKVSAVVQMIRSELASDATARFVVFTTFPNIFQYLTRALSAAGVSSFVIDGSTALKRRAALVAQFQSGGSMSVCMLSSRAGNAGLTLTAANHLIFMEPNLHMQVEAQAIGRIHRFGQVRPVTVTYFAAEDTLETRIRQMARDGALTSQGRELVGQGWRSLLPCSLLK